MFQLYIIDQKKVFLRYNVVPVSGSVTLLRTELPVWHCSPASQMTM